MKPQISCVGRKKNIRIILTSTIIVTSSVGTEDLKYSAACSLKRNDETFTQKNIVLFIFEMSHLYLWPSNRYF